MALKVPFERPARHAPTTTDLFRVGKVAARAHGDDGFARSFEPLGNLVDCEELDCTQNGISSSIASACSSEIPLASA